MAQAFAKAFYRSKEWERARLAYISYRRAIDGGLCETCKDRLGKIVHHKIWLTENNIHNPDIRVGFGNLKLDCQQCHNKEKDPTTVPGRCRYSPEGEILPPFNDDCI